MPRRLPLAAGPVAAQFAIQAPAPPSHTFTVRVVAPHHADVAVWLQTWYGQRLGGAGSPPPPPPSRAGPSPPTPPTSPSGSRPGMDSGWTCLPAPTTVPGAGHEPSR